MQCPGRVKCGRVAISVHRAQCLVLRDSASVSSQPTSLSPSLLSWQPKTIKREGRHLKAGASEATLCLSQSHWFHRPIFNFVRQPLQEKGTVNQRVTL